jgi:hypothetical protein
MQSLSPTCTCPGAPDEGGNQHAIALSDLHVPRSTFANWRKWLAISARHRWQSALISGNQRSPSVAISGGNHSQSAVAIRGNQRSSDVTTGHQAHLIRKDEIEQTRSPALQLVTLTKHVRLDRRDIPRGEEQSERLLDDLAFSSAPVAIRGTQQWQSVAISGNQWHSVISGTHQWHSAAHPSRRIVSMPFASRRGDACSCSYM